MTSSAGLDSVLVEHIMNAIKSKFDLDAASEIKVTSIEIDDVELKIRIELLITTTEKPAALAKSYLGLTGKVREALGSDWSKFFPVITPKINSDVHA